MKISVIIPTLNEEGNIARIIASLRSASGIEKIEIVVADGGSSDRTAAIARGLADKVVETPQPGRALQMQAGALSSSGELLLFLHADTKLPEGWVEELTRIWSSQHRPIATAFRLGFDNSELFYKLVVSLANLRTRITGVPQGDQAIAIRRDVFLKVGGFPPAPLMEEYLLFRKLRRIGRPMILAGSVATSSRRYENNGKILNSLRNTALVALFYLGASPRRLARLYR